MKRLSFALIVLLASCGLMKTTTTNKENRELEISTASQLRKNEQQERLTLTDSIFDHDDVKLSSFDMILWPKGNIRYNVNGGFEGSFDSLLVKGKQQQFSRSSGRLQHGDSNKTTSVVQTDQQKKEKTAEKKVSKQASPDLKVMVGLLILVVALFYYVKKRLLS